MSKSISINYNPCSSLCRPLLIMHITWYDVMLTNKTIKCSFYSQTIKHKQAKWRGSTSFVLKVHFAWHTLLKRNSTETYR